MTLYPNLAARIFDTPLAIMPSKAEAILRAIGPRFAEGGNVEFNEPFMVKGRGPELVIRANVDAQAGSGFEDDESVWRPYENRNGVAIIPVHGTLVQRSSWLGALSGLMSYEDIAETFHMAMDDGTVDGVFLDIDSPGGEVPGLFDMVDSISTRLGEKPVHAHINELSASAAYAVTTVADHVSVPRTGVVASIGVIVVHQEVTKMLDKAGIKMTIIRAGEKKANTNPYEKLSDDARDWLQAEVDRIREIFVSTVARNRGLDEQIVWDTEAAVYGAPDALKIGLVDAVMSAEQAANHLVDTLG